MSEQGRLQDNSPQQSNNNIKNIRQFVILLWNRIPTNAKIVDKGISILSVIIFIIKFIPWLLGIVNTLREESKPGNSLDKGRHLFSGYKNYINVSELSCDMNL